MRWTVVCFLLLLTCAHTAHAQVAISEIMYAPPTIDDKHEWIEMCTGSESYETKDVKLFESNSAHGLTLVRGSSLLPSGTCAVIADDATTFMNDNPSFSGTLFDSSFSLTNTGELLTLKTASGAILDSVTYTDASGAKDDGNSLHRNGTNGLVASSPTPGIETGFNLPNGFDAGTQTTDTTSTTATTSTAIQFHTVTIEPPPQLKIRVPAKITTHVGSLVHFVAEAFNAKGSVVDAQLQWVFGDGYTDVGKKVVHTYPRVGTYIVYVTGSAESLSDEQQIEVIVLPTEVRLEVMTNKDIAVTNLADTSLDLSASKIVAGGQVYVFPEHTFIAPHATVIFPEKLTKLFDILRASSVQLVFSHGDSVASTSVPHDMSAGDSAPGVAPQIFSFLPIGSQVHTTQVSIPPTSPSTPSTALVATSEKREILQKNSDTRHTIVEDTSALQDTPPPVEATKTEVNDTYLASAETATAPATSAMIWVAALLGVLGLGIAPLLMRGTADELETFDDDAILAEQFRIVDVTPKDRH